MFFSRSNYGRKYGCSMIAAKFWISCQIVIRRPEGGNAGFGIRNGLPERFHRATETLPWGLYSTKLWHAHAHTHTHLGWPRTWNCKKQEWVHTATQRALGMLRMRTHAYARFHKYACMNISSCFEEIFTSLQRILKGHNVPSWVSYGKVARLQLYTVRLHRNSREAVKPWTVKPWTVKPWKTPNLEISKTNTVFGASTC